MGKHKNSAQNALLLDFMEKHPDMAKGFVKGDRVLAKAQWTKLKDSLNSLGPPIKDVNGWKKAWTDWKCEIRKKLSHNRIEATATGGGPFKQFTLLEAEETEVRVAAMFTVIEGIPASTPFAFNEEVVSDASDGDDEKPSTSFAAANLARSTSETPRKRKREENLQDSVKTFLKEEMNYNEAVLEKQNLLTQVGKENSSSLRRVYRSMEKLSDIMAGKRQDFKEHHEEERKLMAKKNDIKQKLLEIQGLKLNILQNKNE